MAFKDVDKFVAQLQDEWADPVSGDLGPIYGKQWRNWEGPNGASVDQIAYLVDGIRAVVADPQASVGRRLMLSAWNPIDIPRTKGPSACHGANALAGKK